ncbi:hypothetical protein ACOXXX_08730 [Thalassococcus sp. BH17M4-6]|uniref:hypothetical protein n=1 Tax=Thalassococcus sp. BH17M4-6 TaxID=3413148 RepID=UPI003BCCA1F8
MMSRLLSLIGTVLLLAGAGLAGWWALTVTTRQPGLPSFEMAQPQATRAAPSRAASRPRRPDVYYDAVTQRPLFAPDRRPLVLDDTPEADPPDPVVATPPKPVVVPPPAVRLLGVMGAADENRALVQNAEGEALWLTQGTELAGWTISRIGPNWLDLSRASETIRIEMYQ